nr:MAG TPA: hypothetical protein [Caudoviricetes sp.]
MLCYDVTTQSEKTNPEALAALRGFYLPLIPSLTN